MATPSVQAAAERYGLATTVELDPSHSPVLDQEEQEQLSSACDAVGFYLGDVQLGQGKLYITTRRVIWVSGTTTLSMTYHQVMMHAISKDTSAFPRPCIYLQLDDGSEDMMMGEEGEEEEGEGEELQGASPEVRLVPEDTGKVEELFKSLCDCAALNPDPDNEGEGDFFFNEDEVLAGLDDASRAALVANRIEGGAMALEEGQELDELVGEDPGRFEDDEGEEYEEGEEDGAMDGVQHQNGTAKGR